MYSEGREGEQFCVSVIVQNPFQRGSTQSQLCLSPQDAKCKPFPARRTSLFEHLVTRGRHSPLRLPVLCLRGKTSKACSAWRGRGKRRVARRRAASTAGRVQRLGGGTVQGVEGQERCLRVPRIFVDQSWWRSGCGRVGFSDHWCSPDTPTWISQYLCK